MLQYYYADAGPVTGGEALWAPSCFAFTYTPSPCDPGARFIAPFEADATSPTHWYAGGQFVWDNQNKGWDTR